MNLDQMMKGGWWGASPFTDRLMITYPAHKSNYYSGQSGKALRVCTPICLFWHEPQEPSDGYESTPVYFAGEGRDASTTYYGDNDGDRWQLVPLDRAPIANGWTGDIPLPKFNDGGPEFGSVSLNKVSHSSEEEGYSHNIHITFTNAQYQSAVDLATLEMIMYDWPRNPMRVGMAHAFVASNRQDGIWIATKSGIPQEAVNRVLKLEKDIYDIKKTVWDNMVQNNQKNDAQDIILVDHAKRLNKIEK